MKKTLSLAILLLIVLTSSVRAESSADDGCTGKISFKTVEISIDSKNNALAAYQVDIRYDNRKIKIVGLEGGAEGFNKPPFYDRDGLDGGRIIIASFVDYDVKAKNGKKPVARLHLQTIGCPPFELTTAPMAAAKPGGKDIPIEVEIAFVNPQGEEDAED